MKLYFLLFKVPQIFNFIENIKPIKALPYLINCKKNSHIWNPIYYHLQ